MTIHYNKTLFIAALLLFQIALGDAIYAQKPVDNKSAEVAARAFYKKYLPLFGYPSASELQRLQPFLSGSLYSSIKYERERMKIWSAKNPDSKPPVIEDLFVCNHDEPPTGFRVGKANITSQTAVITVYFYYAENGKIYETCQTKSSLIRVNGKWLLDNVIFEEDADLKTLLSRKDYDVLPQK